MNVVPQIKRGPKRGATSWPWYLTHKFGPYAMCKSCGKQGRNFTPKSWKVLAKQPQNLYINCPHLLHYMQELVSYFADKKRVWPVCSGFGKRWILLIGMAISHFSNRRRFFKTSHKHKAVNIARKLCCCNLTTWLFANSSRHKPTQACSILVSYSNIWTSQY